MRGGREHVDDEVAFARRGTCDATAAAALRLVLADRGALDVAEVRARDDHVLLVDQLLVHDLALRVHDLRAALVGEIGADLLQLVDDRCHQLVVIREQALEVVRELPQLLVLGLELLFLEAGEPAEAHVEDRLRLTRGQVDEPAIIRRRDLVGRPARALEEPAETGELLRHQAVLRDVRVLAGPDDVDDAIDVDDREAEALDDLAPQPRLAQIEQRAAGNDLAAVLDEDLQRLLER